MVSPISVWCNSSKCTCCPILVVICLKEVNSVSLFDDLNKEDYRPASILSHMPKVFERIFYKQIDHFMTSKFSSFLCGFRKNHNSQYSLLKMVEVWKKNIDKGNEIAAILMDLSKAFDTINHSSLLAKLKHTVSL